MDKTEFLQNLKKAIDASIPFSLKYVTNPLPSSCRCLIFPNQSYDKNAPISDEILFPNETLPEGKYLGPFDEVEVVEHLWRNGKVPEWINVSVYTYDDQFTYLELICCGRFSALHLYHLKEGHPPFHVLGPNLPPNWQGAENRIKFDLFWCGKKSIEIL